MTAAVRAIDLTVTIGRTVALPPVDLEVGMGEIVAICGPSGSGKTTLLDCVLSLRRPSRGTIRVLGTDLTTMGRRGAARFRRDNTGMIAQSPDLLPELNVVENVAVPLLFAGVRRTEAIARAAAMLEQVGLAGTERLRPESLSGGEAQRAALARALVAPGTRLLAADEPTAALDAAGVRHVVEVMTTSARANGITVLLATHDPAVVEACDRVHRLRDHVAHGPDARLPAGSR